MEPLSFFEWLAVFYLFVASMMGLWGCYAFSTAPAEPEDEELGSAFARVLVVLYVMFVAPITLLPKLITK